MFSRRACTAFLSAGLLIGGSGGTPASAAGRPAPAHSSAATALSIKAVWLVGGLNGAIYVTSPPGDPRLFVIEQNGLVRLVKDGALLAQPFLDLTGLVINNGERGLLGIAFPDDYATSGLFYVHYSGQPSGATVVARYAVSSNPDVANPASGEVVLTVAQPAGNHNGGQIAFGPDTYLYIGLGDGGGGGDPNNLAQNDDTLLGKMLRIDVSGGPGTTYTIPPTNPFAGGTSPRPEIWSKGLRNPYRWSFDRLTGDLYVGDVGQNLYEEIDVEPAGGPGGTNYGWRLMEGVHCFNPSTGCNDGSLTLPVHEYSHSTGGCAVIGGYVYRGSLPELQGHYFFGDLCTLHIFSFVWDGGGGITQLMDRTTELTPPVGVFNRLTAIGQDSDGELYLVDGALSGGELYKIAKGAVPPAPSPSAPMGTSSTAFPAFTWPELASTPGLVDGAKRYRLWVETDGGIKVIDQAWSAPTICADSVCTVPSPVELMEGGYRWWVRAWNPFGDSPWSARATFTVEHQPKKPVAASLSSPTGVVGTTMPTYSWLPVDASAAGDAATWYRLWVQGPTGNVIDQWYTAAGVCGASLCSTTPAVTLIEGVHRWWIQTWNPTGYGPWSAAASFDVRVATVQPGRAQTVSPAGTIGTSAPAFTWTPPSSGGAASWYRLWVNGPAGPQLIDQWYPAATACSGGSCSVASPTALADGDHVWWVRSWNSAGYGPWSTGRDFTVATTTSDQRKP